jgi:hypothetical protein
VAAGSALLTIRDAHRGKALAAARQLFEEYASSLGRQPGFGSATPAYWPRASSSFPTADW